MIRQQKTAEIIRGILGTNSLICYLVYA